MRGNMFCLLLERRNILYKKKTQQDPENKTEKMMFIFCWVVTNDKF